LKKIPWKEIKKYGPIIVEAAIKIFNGVKKYIVGNSKEGSKHRKVSLEQLEKRVGLLENHEIEQAELLNKIAVQINDLSNAIKIISNRTMLALLISLMSLIILFIVIVIRFVK
jgi:hypothetical protein